MTRNRHSPARHLAIRPGISTRYTLALYLRSTLLIMLILLVTAIAIDLAQTMRGITGRAKATGSSQLSVLAPYLAYRSVDIITRLLPQACFFGVFLAEIIRARRLERVILAISGVSPWRALAPVLLFSTLTGAIQALNENWARPEAVFAQINLGVGAYARWFKPGLKDRPNWFLLGSDALRAKLKIGGNPEMRDIELFRGLDQPRLSSVVMAQRAVPTDKPGIWHLSNAVIWRAQPDKSAYIPRHYRVVDTPIALSPVQVSYSGIAGYYLPSKVLAKIAAVPAVPTSNDADVAIWRRWTAALLPGIFAFLGAGLAQIGYPGRSQNIGRLVGLAVFGYLSIVSVKVFWALGEHGVITAPVAVLSPLLFALAIGLLAQLGQILPQARISFRRAKAD